MKNVADLFVAKDRTTTFWFVMACASILCCGIYVNKMVASVSQKPQYVIMDGNGIFYVAPSVEFPDAEGLHVAQTRLAMELLYTRGPRGLEREGLLRMLYSAKAMGQVQAELAKESKTFRAQEIHQTVTVTESRVLSDKALRSVVSGVDYNEFKLTVGKATLSRSLVIAGKEQNEEWEVTVNFLWRLNPQVGGTKTGPFPSLVFGMILGNPERKKTL